MLQESKSTKIIFLFTPGPIGGAEKIVLYGVKALIDEKQDVEIWVIKEERVPHVADTFIELLKELKIDPKVFSSFKVFDRNLLKNLSKSFLSINPSIIHAHGFKAAFYAKLSSKKNSKLVVTHHGKTGHTLKVKVYEFIEDQVMKRSSMVIAVSNEMGRTLIKSGISKDQIVVVENFLTTNVIPIHSNCLNPLKLLFVGRLSPEKGCSVLIDAMKKLDSEIFHLTVLGDGVEKEKLHKQVNDLGLAKIVTFVGFKKNVNEYMASSNALVMPSFREGQPLTLIEACCMGLPVVASNVGGIPDLVVENSNGYLCEAGNATELAQSIIKLSQNFNSIQSAAEVLKQSYRERFSAKSWAKKTLHVYEMALSH